MNIFLLVFFLSGCCLFSNNQVSFVYNTLPVAVVGMNYHVKVNTRGLPVSIMSVENGHAIHGLKIIPSPTTNVSRWYVDISGIPEREGNILSGYMGVQSGLSVLDVILRKNLLLS